MSATELPDRDRLVMVIDGHCGMCARSARFLRRLDRGERLSIVAAQVPGVRDGYGLTVEQTDAMVWAVGPDGDPVGGARAIGLALATALGGRWPLWPWRVPGVPWLLDRIYRFVADHRGWFPADDPWCDQHPGRCAD
jgi:predicted DCC family thiol-disulfide oxidoreductase YuxK